MAKMDFRKHKVLTAMLLIAVAAVIGSTGATVIHNMALENPIKTPQVEGKIDEILGNGNKVLAFENNGEADVFIRAAFSETWTKGDTILPNSPDKASPQVNPDDWVLGGDGWYYYKKVLPGSISKPGASNAKERKTEPLIKSVSFGAQETLGETYKNASYEIHAVMEVVQASDDVKVSHDAVEALFGKNITIPEGWNGNKYTYTIPWPVQ